MNAGSGRTVAGGCHCRAVRFEVVLPTVVTAHVCNCSICDLLAFEHLIVPATCFRLLGGAGDLTEYRFGTGTARHLFCRVCGVKAFYVPRSNPDGVSVNARCLAPGHGLTIHRELFDGRDWERNAGSLAALSRSD